MIRYATIGRTFSFEAAHQLHKHHGKCKRLHGHTYSFTVFIEGRINENGMVIDFGELKQIVTQHVLDVLDHTLLNDSKLFDGHEPTAEVIAMIIHTLLSPYLPVKRIELHETPDTTVIFKGGF